MDKQQAAKYRAVLNFLGLRIVTDPMDSADEVFGLVNAFARVEEGTAPRIDSIQKYNPYEGSWQTLVFYRKPFLLRELDT